MSNSGHLCTLTFHLRRVNKRDLGKRGDIAVLDPSAFRQLCLPYGLTAHEVKIYHVMYRGIAPCVKVGPCSFPTNDMDDLHKPRSDSGYH